MQQMQEICTQEAEFMCELGLAFGTVCQKDDHRMFVMKHSAPPGSFPWLLCFCFTPLQLSHPNQIIYMRKGKRKRKEKGKVIDRIV